MSLMASNPKLRLKPQTSSLMASNPLMDSLTSHISLYHSSISLSNPPPNLNPHPRSSILKWLSSLTVHQRQASITAVDHGFTQILLQMLGKLRTQGHGFFFILPDLPSRDGTGLPGLCFRKSRGLLARVSESNESERLIHESIRMFGSKEGESVDECSCSARVLDTVTVSEEFVENVDRFVAAMDSVSNGGFLRGEENVVLGLNDWVELGWLKEKGYYSIEAFVANRLEVALRLAWLNSNNGKKRGAKLKEKVNSAGVAANVYWRNKGCVDWWSNLDAALRKRVLTMVLAKAAKSLTNEILKGANRAMEDEAWLSSAGVEESLTYNSTKTHRRITKATSVDAEFGLLIIPATDSNNSTPFASSFNSLFVILDILTLILSCRRQEYDKEKLFYSTLGSVSTIADCISRKLRGLLMVVSLDCIKLELLGEGNLRSPPNKCKEKLGAGSRRKNGRARNTKRLNPAPRNHGVDCTIEEPLKKTFQDHRSGLIHKENADHVKLDKISAILSEKNQEEDSSSAIEMVVVDAKVRTAARKSRRARNKTKKSSSDNISRVRNLETEATESSSPTFVFQCEASEPNRISDASFVRNGASENSTTDHYMPKSSSHNSMYGRPKEENTVQSTSSDVVSGCTGGSCHSDLKCHDHQYSNSVIENQSTVSREGKLDNAEDRDIIPSVVPPPRELNGPFGNKSSNFWNSGHLSGNCTNSVTKATDSKEGKVFIKGQECGSCDTKRTSSTECLSYEWPSVAPLHISMVNSHIPAATDRLHLDVGRNWHNHFHQSFVPTMHHTRNPSIEGGCSRMVSRPLPMSLDWPPMVRGAGGLAPSMACNYDYKFISRRQSSFQQAFTAQNVRIKATTIEDERKYFGDSVELSDLSNTQEVADDGDIHWISEEEYEVHAVSGMDYNQYFGGGVMYWDPSDHPGTGFSRPPSLSSDDSSWAWHEADMKRSVDDMVAFSSSYSTNGLNSPTAASFCSPFDPLGTAHQALGYVMSGNEVTGKLMHPASTVTDAVVEEKLSGSLANLPGDVEGKSGDSLPYPILPPIIIPNVSRERSRSEFKRSHDHKSPCVPPSRRDQPRIKRPPSPVVLCVPQAPRPPPPSPASDSRKQRGFPTVRSGSSSPRNWGVTGWYHDGANFEESCICMDGTEIFLPSWSSNNLSARPMIQPLPGALLPDRLIAISQITRDQEHPDVYFPIQPPDLLNCPARKAALPLMQSFLHDEIDSFCKQVAAENTIRKPYINWAVKRVTRSLQVLWPRSRTNIFGSITTGLSLPSSDVDLVVCLPPVRNLEPIKEAGILEGRNGIKETCLQHAARYLANQEWVKNDSLKTVENTAIPIIMLVVEVPCDLIRSATSNVTIPKDEPTWTASEQGKQVNIDMVGLENSASPRASNIHDEYRKNSKSVRVDISFKSPSHTGVQTTKLVKELTEQFPAATPLALVLKQFLADRSLDQSYCGGLSSYCLVLLITRFLQHEHHLGRPINQKFGSLLMDFLYFFGNVFDPRQMRISVQGSGVYIKRERGYSIDPIHIDDPLFPTNNVGRNCFRIHQCIKAFSDAYSILESELTGLPTDGDLNTRPPCRLLPKIIPSIDLYRNFNECSTCHVGELSSDSLPEVAPCGVCW